MTTQGYGAEQATSVALGDAMRDALRSPDTVGYIAPVDMFLCKSGNPQAIVFTALRNANSDQVILICSRPVSLVDDHFVCGYPKIVSVVISQQHGVLSQTTEHFSNEGYRGGAGYERLFADEDAVVGMNDLSPYARLLGIKTRAGSGYELQDKAHGVPAARGDGYEGEDFHLRAMRAFFGSDGIQQDEQMRGRLIRFIDEHGGIFWDTGEYVSPSPSRPYSMDRIPWNILTAYYNSPHPSGAVAAI